MRRPGSALASVQRTGANPAAHGRWCDEGCGCRATGAEAVRIQLSGSAHWFCCRACAESFSQRLDHDVDRAIRRLVRPGNVVADLGCGSGTYTKRLTRAVGPRGRVYASDRSPRRLGPLRRWIARNRLGPRVVIGLAKGGRSPFIPDRSVDFVLSRNTLCCLSQRRRATDDLLRILRDRGSAYVSVTGSSPPGVRRITDREWASFLRRFRSRRTWSIGRLRVAELRRPKRSRTDATARPTRHGPAPSEAMPS